MSYRTGGAIVFVVAIIVALFGTVVGEHLFHLPDVQGQPAPPLVAVGFFRIMVTWFAVIGAIVFVINEKA